MTIEKFKFLKSVDCNCFNWGRTFDNLLASHHPNCSKFIPELVSEGAIVYSRDRKFMKKIYIHKEASFKFDNLFFCRNVDSYFKHYNFDDANDIFELEDKIEVGDSCYIKCNDKNKNLIPYFRKFRIESILIANCLTILYYIDGDQLCFIEKYFDRSDIHYYK